jgi:hypothetical protein
MLDHRFLKRIILFIIRTVIIGYMGGWFAFIVLYNIIAVILVIWKVYNHYNKKN